MRILLSSQPTIRSPNLLCVIAHTLFGINIVYLQTPSFQSFTVQSSPPDTISPVSKVSTTKTKPAWPLKSIKWVPSKDHNLIVSSFEHETKAFSSGTSAKQRTISSWAFSMTFSCFPLYQSLIALSWLPVIVIPLGRVKTAVAWVWPDNFSFEVPVFKSHMIAVPSHDPLTNSSSTL